MADIFTIVISHAAAASFGFASNALLVMLERRRTRAVNSVRILTSFFCKYLPCIESSDSDVQKSLATSIHQWMEYPNALGSESRAANLVGQVCAYCSPSNEEIKEADRALNALDQRATEREREKDRLRNVVS